MVGTLLPLQKARVLSLVRKLRISLAALNSKKKKSSTLPVAPISGEHLFIPGPSPKFLAASGLVCRASYHSRYRTREKAKSQNYLL